MNPYGFVRVNWDQPAERRPAPPHDRWLAGALHGRFEARLTTLTPFFIPSSGTGRPASSQLVSRPLARRVTGGRGTAYVIPASSIKGLLRSVFEALTQSCFTHGAPAPLRLPAAFQPCRSRAQVCPACRVFGFMGRGQGAELSAGALCLDECLSEPGPDRVDRPLWTLPTAGPKPEHSAFYGVEAPAGRKFYYHQVFERNQCQVANGPAQSGPNLLNAHIQPIFAGVTFTFGGTFENLHPDELDYLLYALCLEDDLAHKLGYAKPLGLGSVRIELSSLTLLDPLARYAGIRRPEPIADVAAYLGSVRERVGQQLHGPTIEDLRRIWRWPPDPDLPIGYPDRDWFHRNPQAPLDETWEIGLPPSHAAADRA